MHQIGVGALGPVYRTYEPERDRLVAVKVFRLDITPEQARSLADELSRIAGAGLFHPSIVEPITAGVEGSLAYSAEEYVAAESLDVAMRHYAPAPIDTVLPFVTQLAGAIDFARAAGVGHGALHPRDMFMSPDEARVTGFGVVEALERIGVRAPVRRPYTAPERIAGSTWASPADVFSVAAVTYELLTGRRPAGLGSEIGLLTSVDGPSGALHAVLARGMDEDPSRRYPTALAFASALEAAAHGRASDESAGPAVAGLAPPDAATAAIAAGAAARLNLEDPAQTAGGDDWPVDTTGSAHQEDKTAETADPDADIFVERDDDEAHQQWAIEEWTEADRRQAEAARPDTGLDEDIQAESEADRYAADDFLLDAAGAAAATEVDDFRSPRAESVGGRSMEDERPLEDETRRDEPAPLLFDREEAPAKPTVTRPVPEPPPHREPVSTPAPVFAQYADAPAPERTSRRWPLALILGVLLGLMGGYALWGRPDSSEQGISRQSGEPGGSQQTAAASSPATTSVQRPTEATPAPTPETQPAGPPSEAPAVPAPSGDASTASPEAAPRATSPGSGTSATGARRSPAPARPRTGSIVVRSTPSGAGVTLNGRWRGRTPLVLEDLPFAKYEVRVVQPGYVTGQQVVTLSAGEPERTLSLRLGRRPGSPVASDAPSPSGGAGRGTPSSVFTGTVFVDSRPRGAKVFINGKEVGTTPLSVPDVAIGTHVVRLELPDHRTWTSTTRVSAGQQSRVTGSLEQIR